jgi:hypothetical protein
MSIDDSRDIGQLMQQARDIKRIAFDPARDPAYIRLYRNLKPVYIALCKLERRSPSQQMIVDDLVEIFEFKGHCH